MLIQAFVASTLMLHSFAVVVAITIFNHITFTSTLCKFSLQFLFPGQMRPENPSFHFVGLVCPLLTDNCSGTSSLG